MHNSKLLSIPLFIPVFIMVMAAVPSMAADLQSTFQKIGNPYRLPQLRHFLAPQPHTLYNSGISSV